MTTPRSKRLAGPVLVTDAGGAVLAYTCPAGKVALVKSIRVTTPYGNAAGVTLFVGAVHNDTVVLRAGLAGNATYIDPDTDPIVLHAGESIRASHFSAGGTGHYILTLSGAEMSA